MRWLKCQLRAPIASFGSETIDSFGGTGLYPAQSMLTGMIANALGWHRSMREEHQALQDRLICGLGQESDAAKRILVDYQTAKLNKDDTAWTTSGKPTGRDGDSYSGSHQRWRSYLSDLQLFLVIRLSPEDDAPTLDDIASAFDFPARPVFVGRKSCLPSANIRLGWIEASGTYQALEEAMEAHGEPGRYRVQWPSESAELHANTVSVTDERDWQSGLHGGLRFVCNGTIEIEATE